MRDILLNKDNLMLCRMLIVQSVMVAGSVAVLPAQVRFGVVGGFVSASASISPPQEALTVQSRSGVAIGLSMTTAISRNVDFAPELMYVNKGIKGSAGFGSFTATITDKIDYIEAPLLVRFMPEMKGSARISLMAGPTIAVRVKCSISQQGIPDEPESQDCDDPFDPTAGPRSTDFGAMFGVGVHSGRLSLSVRYEAGLINISKDDTTDASTAKNKALFILLGYSFGK
jgi:hypothetical protein